MAASGPRQAKTRLDGCACAGGKGCSGQCRDARPLPRCTPAWTAAIGDCRPVAPGLASPALSACGRWPILSSLAAEERRRITPTLPAHHRLFRGDGSIARITQSHPETIAAALASGAAAKSRLVASWARSAQKYGLDPSLRLSDQRLSEAEIQRLRQEIDELLHLARPTLDRLFAVVKGLGACLVIADRHGIPLERRGNAAEDAEFAGAGLWIGTRWAEAQAGTNGIGTCLAEERAVVIHRDQHFLAANTGLSCISAPLHDAEGQLVGVLDVSTLKGEAAEGMMPLLSQSVTEAARQIEADLFHAHFARARILLVPGSDRGIAALLAVDSDELVIGATRAARQHLGLRGNLLRHPVPAADLLGLATHHDPAEGERAVIARALARNGGNLSAAARSLGLSRATLHRKLGRQG